MDKKYAENPNTPEMLEWLYTKRWKPETERINDWMFPKLFKILKRMPSYSFILEVGCGFGKTLDEIGKKFPTFDLTGIDISKDAINGGKEFYDDNIKLECMNFENYDTKFENKFDVIICSQTLEHVDYPFAIMDNMKRSLKKNGNLFITVPWPKSNLDNGVKSHFWRFYPDDFKNFYKDCKVLKEGTRLIAIWKK